MREVQPAVLIRESSTRLLIYFFLDTCVRYCTHLYYYTDFQVLESLHGGPEFSGNYRQKSKVLLGMQ